MPSPQDETSHLGHEIRNIMAVVLIFSEQIEKSADPRTASLARQISNAAEACAALCKAVSDVRRTDMADDGLVLVDVAGLLGDVSRQVAGSGSGDATFEVICSSDLSLTTRKAELNRILLTLAVHMTMGLGLARDRRIQLRAGRLDDTDGSVVIELEDNGNGFDIPCGLATPVTRHVASDGFCPHDFGLQSAFTLTTGLGGRLALVRSNGLGTLFRLTLSSGS